MCADPAFLFYSSDFLTGTTLMTDEQVGKYIRLMCLQHQTGHLAEKHMLNICKTYDEDIFRKFKKDGDGKYYNERLENEIIKRSNYSKSRRANRLGRVGVSEHRGDICKTYVDTYVGHMENENDNENENEKRNKRSEKKYAEFDIFWKAYPKKKSKGEAEKAWKSIKPSEELLKTILSGLSAAKTSRDWTKEGGRYIPHPATWLRAKGWEDEQTYTPSSNPFLELLREEGIG